MSSHSETPESSPHRAEQAAPALGSPGAKANADKASPDPTDNPYYMHAKFEALLLEAGRKLGVEGLPQPASSVSQDRSGATEPYSVRVSADVKRRFCEAIAKEGGRPAPFFEKLIELYEETIGASDTGLAEPFARVRRNVEGHMRALVVALTADLRDLEETADLQESETTDLMLQLHELQTKAEKERAQFESQRRHFEQERADWAAEQEAARVARARLEEETGDLRASLRALNQSLTEVRAKADAAAGQRERIAQLEQKLAETDQRAARADLHREEADLKLARALEDVDRARKALDENEALRIRQHQTSEEERKAIQERLKAQIERLEETVDRLQSQLREKEKTGAREHG